MHAAQASAFSEQLKLLGITVEIVNLADHLSYITEIAELHHAEWQHLDASFTVERRKTALEDAARREGIPSVYIAINNREFVGSAALVEHDMRSYRPNLTPWLAAVFVREGWRGKGIASQLVSYCEAKAAQATVLELYLYTEFASGLYSKLGWETIESCDYKGFKVDIMSKAVALL